MKKEKRRDIASAQNVSCFTGEEISLYKFGGASAELKKRIFYHLNVEKCKRCKKMYCVVTNDIPPKPLSNISYALHARKVNVEFQKIRKKKLGLKIPENLEKGQIWTTVPEVQDEQGKIVMTTPAAIPVIIFWPGEQKGMNDIIRVMPTSTDINFCIDKEGVVLRDDVLKYPFLVEIFNERPMFVKNLYQFCGSVKPTSMKRIEAARQKFLKNESASILDADYSKWKQKEIQLTEYLTLPVNLALRDV